MSFPEAWPLAAILTIVTAAGCKEAEGETKTRALEVVGPVMEEPPPSAAAGEASRLETMARPLSIEERQDFQRQMGRKLKELEVSLEDLHTRAEAAGEEARELLVRAMVEMEERKDDLERKLRRLESSAEEVWPGARRGVESAMADLRRIYHRTRQDVQDHYAAPSRP